jgi:hypothetical protein
MKFLQTYSLAKQQAVIPLLLNEMLAQELKEAILAYFFLWQSPNDTPELLDDECEHHLHSFHGETIDFDVKDALIKLKQLGIITYIHTPARCCCWPTAWISDLALVK